MDYTMVILLIALSIAVLAAILIAAVAGVLAWIGGAHPAAIIARASAAFAGSFTLAVLVISLLITTAQ